ncbi:transposase [Stieleria sp. ICT_E10.1]|uniref:IS66 family insertion sequence element accessory protein TnpA n=1 Tax=Stieleria sedimenti TaxID=2976331 RepID=UPI0021806DDB|nr:transposase [Stieleria sedimenti]MCS7468012.1 transposase [Stieleria sedimenti]
MARMPDPAVRQRWQRLIRSYDDTDCSIAEFCELHEVSTASFYAWRRRLKSGDHADGFLKVEIAQVRPVPNYATTVHFGCGTRIEVDSRDTETLLHIVDRLRRDDQGANA